MCIRFTPQNLQDVMEVDSNCAKHISVINDIYSWEKELHKSLESNSEGSSLCSSVKVVSEECNLDLDASKRVLWLMCREWELVHLACVEKLQGAEANVVTYCRGLGYQMSGNELWSRTTHRYAQ